MRVSHHPYQAIRTRQGDTVHVREAKQPDSDGVWRWQYGGGKFNNLDEILDFIDGESK